MLLAYLLLATGLTISAVAIYYSVVGLTAIFSAAVIPIIVMGSALEIAKLVCASWLKANWERIPLAMKAYMSTAVVILMIITSMGIFGFLSKAHNDQNLVSGDVQSKIAIYDEKIKTAKDNIEADRKQLKQMDEAVDQIMGRSTDEKGADKANAVRKSQQRDRQALAKDIEANQKIIATLNDEAAPIRAEVRKVEAEVGPIKYIAKFIYGEQGADENFLEKAVTWIIITIVIVFDPLAVIMLLAAQMTFGWNKRNWLDDQEDELNEAFIGENIPEGWHQELVPDTENPWRDDPPAEPIKEELVDHQIKDIDHEDADNDVIIVKVDEPKIVPEPEPEIEYQVLDDYTDEEFYTEPPKKEIEVVNSTHLVIDGEEYYYKDLVGEHTEIESALDVARDLESTGEYKITHTASSVIVSDENGNKTEIPVEPNPIAMTERPGDYVEKTYIQNEEQRDSGVWQEITNKISEDEYIKKSQEKLNKKENSE